MHQQMQKVRNIGGSKVKCISAKSMARLGWTNMDPADTVTEIFP